MSDKCNSSNLQKKKIIFAIRQLQFCSLATEEFECKLRCRQRQQQTSYMFLGSHSPEFYCENAFRTELCLVDNSDFRVICCKICSHAGHRIMQSDGTLETITMAFTHIFIAGELSENARKMRRTSTIFSPHELAGSGRQRQRGFSA